MNPWDATWTLDPTEAAARLATVPALAGRPVTFLSAGWDNQVFSCGPDLLLRTPRRPVAIALLQTEAAVLPLLAPHLPVPIPAPVHHCPADATGRPFSVVPFFPGETACRVDPDRLDSALLAADLGLFLRRLHAVVIDDDLQEVLPGDEYRRTDLPRRRDLVRSTAAELERLLGDQSAQVWAWLDAHVDLAIPARHTVVHGDLYARHVVLSPTDRLTTVIDWGDVHLGAPGLDLAVAWSVVPTAHRTVFFEAYGPVSAETLMLARFRALFHGCRTLVYADDIHDVALRAASRRAISAVLADPG